MNIKCIVFSLIISSIALHAEQQNIQTPNTGTTTVTINLNTANTAGLTQQNQLHQQADHHSTQKNHTTTNDSDLQKKLYKFYQEQTKSAHNGYVGITSWVAENIIKTTAIVIVACYSTIAYQIYQSNLIINDPSSWSNWHNSSSLNDLFATPQNKLESDLLFAIQTRYVHPVNPTDFIYSIVQASNSLQEELKIVQEQIIRYKWIETCRCMPLFFIDAQDIASLQEKHRKLSFIKHLFASWCANYKINKNN